jgi:hypothetical protein
VSELATAPSGADELPLYRVAAMPQNALVESGDVPLRFTLEGVATWTLEPHGRVVVRTVSEPHVVELEHGTLVAEVVPRHDTDELVESFAVEAGTTRVAVHGTVFSVQRSGDRVTVDVMRGSVAVGPAGHRGPTVGHLLVSPARAAFSTHGGRLLDVLPRPAEDLPPVAVRHESEPSAPLPGAPAIAPPALEPAPTPRPIAHGPEGSHASPEAPAPPMIEPPAAPPPLDVDEARAIVVACLTGSMGKATGDTVVTVSSQVTAHVGSDGTIGSVRFAPPLRPDLQQRCGGALFGRTVAGASSLSFRVTFAQR